MISLNERDLSVIDQLAKSNLYVVTGEFKGLSPDHTTLDNLIRKGIRKYVGNNGLFYQKGKGKTMVQFHVATDISDGSRLSFQIFLSSREPWISFPSLIFNLLESLTGRFSGYQVKQYEYDRIRSYVGKCSTTKNS